MSANVHAILVGLLSVPHTPEQAEHAARTVLDLHAHELAERQRAALPDVMDRWVPLHQDAISEVIDLIDPKAQRATEGDTP
ncbi:hypothetical protein [Streptomyces sp. NPDC085596]|uniref:hypothetical protein n=1 Tax=Streptomyces sp. NPDC085596 TaxID=3365731 RepID=UPI0037D1B93C